MKVLSHLPKADRASKPMASRPDRHVLHHAEMSNCFLDGRRTDFILRLSLRSKWWRGRRGEGWWTELVETTSCMKMMWSLRINKHKPPTVSDVLFFSLPCKTEPHESSDDNIHKAGMRLYFLSLHFTVTLNVRPVFKAQYDTISFWFSPAQHADTQSCTELSKRNYTVLSEISQQSSCLKATG